MIPLFAEPLWLVGGFGTALALLLLFLFTERRSMARLHRFAAPSLVDRLTASHSRRRLWVKHSLLVLSVLLLGASLARPQWGADWEKAETRGIDVMIALDTSKSMLATDISPNRLERSKLAILDLLEVVRGDRVGLIAFAGNAFLQCPLTLDYSAFRQTLAAVDTDTIPVGGTDVASAIDEAEAYFEQTDNERILILITDGEDLEASGIQRAREAAENGTRILSVGVGSARGELIPVINANNEQDFLRDASGKPVSTSLDEETLRRIAQVSNGLYAPLGATGDGLLRVYEYNLAQSESTERNEMLQRIPIERFQWPLALAVLILMLEQVFGTRRRNRGSAGVAGGIPVILFLMAGLGTPGDLPANPKSEAVKAYQDNRYEESLTLYREAMEADPENPKLPYNGGVSAYKSDQFEEAIGLFEQVVRSSTGDLQVKAFYNTGNSRVAYGFDRLETDPGMTRGQWEAALLDYQNAIALDPDHRKTAANLDALRNTIEAHTYMLTVVADPEDGGHVSEGGPVFHGIPTAIEATAADGWEFIEWSGESVDDPEKAQTSVVLKADQTVSARFIKTWNLEVLSADPERGTAGESGTYREDQPVPIKAEAMDYFAFSGWTAEGCEVADPAQAETEVTLSQDARVTASFVPAFKLSAELDPEIGGQAGPSGFFEEYSVVPIQAQPRDGFEWVGWTGDGIKDPEALETSITLTADRVAIAKMNRIWNLVIVPVPEEGGTVEGAGNHPVGTTVPIKAEPTEGFTFTGWEGPGVADPQSAETEVTVQSTTHTLFARFTQDDQQDQDQQQDEDQDQNEDQQQDQDQQSSENDSDSPEEEREPEQDDQSGEQEQPEDQSQPEEQEAEPEQEDSGEQQEQQETGEPQQEQAVPLQMTRDEARQLLNALSENERYLPASERSQERETEQPTPGGRDW